MSRSEGNPSATENQASPGQGLARTNDERGDGSRSSSTWTDGQPAGPESAPIRIAQAQGEHAPALPTAQGTSDTRQNDDAQNQPSDSATGVPGLPAQGTGTPGTSAAVSGDGMDPLRAVTDETPRWGRDDIKRLEMGSQGETLTTGIGGALGHLVGLGDEEPGRRNGEKFVSSDNGRFIGETAGVGQGIDHLWTLGDFDYARASSDDPDQPVFGDYSSSAPEFLPLSSGTMSFSSREGTVLSGRIFDPVAAGLPVTQRSIATDPATGTVTLNADGTFSFLPSNGFSGVAEITFELVDPRTGLAESGTITVVVAAVADPATVSGAATTPEDVRVATPVTIALNDPDGSEEIEKVVITGLPAGAQLDWNVALPGSVSTEPGGRFVVTGTTQQITAIMASLGVTPPANFHGRITLGIAVTSIEANVDPGLPGYRDRTTVNHDYHIDVTAVADPVTVTGDTETTDEDVAVHLDDLAATFGDLTDGSETHVVEIRGVDSDAKLQNAAGVEYTFSIAGDGTKTYTLSPSAVGAVFFLPPPDESGTFNGMTIVAIATEGSNGDRRTASAPISVLVNPVADPVDLTATAQTTNEDTAVTFGDNISIVINDPATQTLSRVVVTGFPVGATVTYTPVGGGAPIVALAGAGFSVTLDGGTESQIRAALATLTLTPPAHTDQNITLSISATTEDLGAVTHTQTIPMTITVAAVADGPAISGVASGNEDQPIALPVTVSRIDADGSEQYDFAQITLPAGVTLTHGAPPPNGITVNVAGSVHTFRPGPATTAAQFEAFLATGLQVQAPADSDVNFGVSVRIGTIESVLSGGEVTLLRAEQTHTVAVTVHPVVDAPTITGASSVDEDKSVTFGSNIAITQNDKSDGSEAITRIVLGNIPASATVTFTAVGGTTVTPVTVAGITTYTLIGGSEDNIRATLATFALQPPLHSDQNIAVSVAVTKVDRTTTEGEAASTSTVNATHTIAVAAVADGPTISGVASGNEDQPIALPVTVSRIDADGSEQYDFAQITVPSGVTLIHGAPPPNGITVSVAGSVHTFRPGPATTAAQFEAFLAIGLQVRAPTDSDVNFGVSVRVGTIESVPSGGEVTLLRAEQTHNVAVTVHPVIDAPAITGASSVNEDGIVNVADQSVTAAVNFGANIGIGAPDSSDGSEAITRVVISGLPIGAVVTFTPIGGISTTFTVDATTTSITLGGGGQSEAQIRAALATLSLVPPTHSDADITLGIRVDKSDATGTEGEAAATGTFNGTHVITVAAVADVPTGSGSGTGLEDQNIPVSITVGHADASDGSERLKNVVIAGVPAGFTLTETSAGVGVLSHDALSGNYTVTGATDAAIQDVLQNLSLQFVLGGARQHLDTDFNLSVTVTTIESAAGAGQNALPEASHTFSVPISVSAVADGVTQSGSSVLVEDVTKAIGSDIAYSRIDNDGTEAVSKVEVTGFLSGSTVTYTDVAGNPHTELVGVGGLAIEFTGGTEAQIRTALNTLNVRAPANTDANFSLSVSVTTNDNDASSIVNTFNHVVVVQAVADAPAIDADDIALNEDSSAVLAIRPDRSADNDGSETLSVRLTVPQDGGSVIGTLTATSTADVTFAGGTGGVYTVVYSGASTDPAVREAALDAFLAGSITFTPRAQWSGVMTGTSGIKVEAISTEAATGYGVELGPNNNAGAGTGGDLDTQVEITTTHIDVTVAAVTDTPTMTNAGTIVRENNNSTATSDPDLVVPIGTRLGLTIADTDGSESLSLTLTGLPTNAQALTHTPLAGVTVTTDIPTGTVTISGANANNVLTVLNSLSVRLADDDDRNFTVTVNGTSTDSNGVTPVSSNFSLTHSVVVMAVADLPSVNRGSIIKPAVDEDSGFVAYPVTVSLNDTDGSETFQSVRVDVSALDAGERPVTQFTAPGGATIDTSATGTFVVGGITFVISNVVGTGRRIEISGGTTADIQAVVASMQIRPGSNNGSDISVAIRATSVERNPSEDNNGAAVGMGGGVAGPEISVATAVTTQTFTIPVNPVPDAPTLVLPAAPTGTEDTSFALGTITVSSTDTDGSEVRHIEIDTSSFPAGTVFTSGGAAVGSVVTAGWTRIPETALSNLQIQAPLNYSGSFALSVRGVVVDTAGTDVVTVTTAPQTLTIAVTPVADPITAPSASVGVEDQGAVAFGADLANVTTGLRITDKVVGGPGEGGSETLTRVVLDLPADTATLTYTVTDTGGNPIGTQAGSGSALIAFDAVNRIYTITSTIITGAADPATLSDAQRAQAETDIRATLATFRVEMGPTHTDLNGLIAVTATALDVKDGVASTRDTSFDHTVRIQAVADTPTLTVNATPAGVTEDGANIALTINAGNSPDTDNSETLSVRITVPTDALGPVGTIVGTTPAGVTLTHQGGGVYLVSASGASNAAREALLDGFLAGGIAFDPRANWSGSLTGTNGLKIEAVSTEAATGVELAPGSFGGADGTSKTETVVAHIDIVVAPSIDAPTVKGNGVGTEDTTISIPMSVTLADKDGSETFSVRITGGVPAGARIFGAGGAEILPQSGGPFDGQYVLSQADVAALAIRPPLHYSSPQQGDITLVTVTDVTDNSGATSVTTAFTNNIVVEVRGVADVPATRTVAVTADEDAAIALGNAILTSAGGNLNNLLVDTDGSEALSFVIGGLPAGVIPTSAIPSGVIYIGSGTWSVTAAAMASLELPPVPNFSGENPYTGVTVKAVTQEIDGDQAASPLWDVTIAVNPVIAGGTVDGFSSWSLGTTVSEQQNEAAAQGVSLASTATHVFVDNDGSERVISYTFDLSGLIAGAGIAQRVQDLLGPGAGLNEIVAAGLISGTFTYDGGTGRITVAAGDIAGVVLSASLFLDSNQDFSIPVEALVRDSATIGGTPVSVDKTETGTFSVNLVGTADTPTVSATGGSGASGTAIAIALGGASTDTDIALGRAQSEEIFFVLRTTNPGTAPVFGLVDSGGNVIGLDTGNGSFMLTPAEIGDVRVLTPSGAGGTIELELTTVATENDGSRATNSTTLQVVVTPVVGPGPGTAPLPPTVTVGASNGNEDGSITLNVTAVPAPGDTTSPHVSVLISGLPTGATVTGATLLPPVNPGDPPIWVASAAAINGGGVSVTPPTDFSGTMSITVEGIARNANLLSSSSGAQALPVEVDPVADGVAISATPATGSEDAPVNLNISLAERDTDGNETIGNFSYVLLNNGATLLGGFAQVAAGDGDATINGTSLVGFYRVPTANVGSLQIQAATHWHGTVTATVAAFSVEPADDNDGDNIKLDTSSFSVKIAAVADAPAVSAPASVSGNEDADIAIPGLSAALVDAVATNGAEALSAVISGVPAGARFSAGSNNGDGSWTIPVGALPTLTFTPPLHYSGTMSLTLTAIALETSNGNEASSSTVFNVVVAPQADTVEILAANVAIGSKAEADLALNVRMADDNGTTPGENAPELIRITFSSVPTGVSILAGDGGTVTNPGAGTWVFLGTEAQSNGLSAFAGAGATAGTHVVNLSAVTIDGASTLTTPVTDVFQLTVPQVLTGDGTANTRAGGTGTQLIYGLAGDDTLNGGAGDDFLVGGDGADNLTGDAGVDTFAWLGGEIGTGVDTITDFVAGPGGDRLDISRLLTGFDPATSVLSEFVSVTTTGADTSVAINADGGGDSFQALAVLQGIIGLDSLTMQTNGNLVV